MGRARRENDLAVCRQHRPLEPAAPASSPADAALEGICRDLAALADVETKHNAFLQGHARQLREAGELGRRLEVRTESALAQTESALARIDQLEQSLRNESAELRAKLAECDAQLRLILGSRVWRWYQRLARVRSRLGTLGTALFRPICAGASVILGIAERSARGKSLATLAGKNRTKLPLTLFCPPGI